MKNTNILSVLTTLLLWSYIGFVAFILLYDFSSYNEKLPRFILGIAADKVIHFIIFLSFSIVLSLYRRYHPQVKWMQHDIVLLLLGLLFAFITELSQLLFTSYRSFSFYDIFADLYGVILGMIIVKIVQKIFGKTDKSDRLTEY